MEDFIDGYPVYKGLQKPLEFMGIRGKFLAYAAGVVGGGFFIYLLFAFLVGKFVGFLALLVTCGGGYLFIIIKQREGLHSKKKYRGVVVYKGLFITDK